MNEEFNLGENESLKGVEADKKRMREIDDFFENLLKKIAESSKLDGLTRKRLVSGLKKLREKTESSLMEIIWVMVDADQSRESQEAIIEAMNKILNLYEEELKKISDEYKKLSKE